MDFSKKGSDNDVAFDTKLAAIKKSSNELRLAYYIYTDDFSSSVFNQALIEAAQKRNVKIKILVDYLKNYRNFDLFAMLVKKGKGRIDVRFYNRPTSLVLKDVYFMTMGCPEHLSKSNTACSDYKWFQIDPLFETAGKAALNLSNFWSTLFISGVYGKFGDMVKSALFYGARIKPENFKGTRQEASPKELQQLRELIKVIWQSQVKGDMDSKVKLAIAMQLYSDKVAPIYQMISTLLPIERDGELKYFEAMFFGYSQFNLDYCRAI